MTPKTLMALGAALFCAACFGSAQTVPVNLDFSRTNYGYINSGGYTAGSLFEWDRAGNKLTFLGNVPGFDTPDNPDNKNILAEYQGGVELGGEFEQFASVSADAAIRRRSAFEIENGNRVPFNNVYSRLTGFLADDARAGGSVMQEWGMTEAIDDPDTLYVIIRDVTYGDKINLLVEGEAKVGGAFSVPLQGDKSFEIKIEGRGLEEIKGDNVAVSFFVYVLEPYWLQGEDAQTFAVRRVKRLDVSGLPALLRGVGTAS
jgi:hypothetical protein